jgi:hypothetical protein
MDEYEKYFRNEYESLKEETTDIIKFSGSDVLSQAAYMCMYLSLP